MNIRKPIHRTLAAAFVASLLLVTPAFRAADVFGPPSTVSYQGKVLDAAGSPLAPDTPANYEIEFRLWDAQSAGVLVWAEKQLVTVNNGNFSIRLGEGTAIMGVGGASEGAIDHDAVGLPGAFNGKDRFLGITVKIPGQSSAEITPRLSFLTSPFSYVAARAQTADSVNQPSGSPASNLNVGSVSFSNQTLNSSSTISSSSHTVLVNSTSGKVTATLPAGASAPNRQLLISKKDASTNQVIIATSVGGSINGTTNSTVALKVLGESVTIQNVGGDNWWIVADCRDKTPAGTIQSFGGGTVPAGYLLCNGSVLNRTDHPDLFAAISTSWGTTAPTNFSVPDLRGVFLRGRADGNIRDEDRANRTNSAGTEVVGDVIGSYQSDGFKGHNHGGIISTNATGDHTHTVTTNIRVHATTGDGHSAGAIQLTDRSNYWSNGAAEVSNTVSTTGNHSHTVTIPANGGSETRPENFSVNYIIKY
jgi:microcystin-dependent protein